MGRRRAQEGIVFQYKGGEVMARPGKGMECVNAVRGGGCVCKSRAACGGPSPGRTRANWPRECAGADTRWARAHHVRVCLEATMCWEQNADGSTVPECAGIVRFSNSEPCWGGTKGTPAPSRHQQLGTPPSPSPSTGASVALADMGDLSLALSLSLSLSQPTGRGGGRGGGTGPSSRQTTRHG